MSCAMCVYCQIMRDTTHYVSIAEVKNLYIVYSLLYEYIFEYFVYMYRIEMYQINLNLNISCTRIENKRIIYIYYFYARSWIQFI